MSHEYIGATIEIRCVPMWSLTAIAAEAQTEMKRRAWVYIQAIGYKPFRMLNMEVSVSTRNSATIVSIACDFEENHRAESLKIDVPYKLFEAAVPHRAAEVES